MKKFLLNTFLFVLPLIILLLMIISLYCIFDPFKVVKEYDYYYETFNDCCVELNKGYISLKNFEHNYMNQKYNSFIFGNSRSMFYEIDDWMKYLNTEDQCYHFDASSEVLTGIYNKIKYLDEQGVELDNVILVIDHTVFRDDSVERDSHLLMLPPQLNGNKKYLKFHLSFLKVFFTPKFFVAYLDYMITEHKKDYMDGVLFTSPFVYDAIRNEVRFEFFEQLIEDGDYYTEERMKVFFKRTEQQNFADSFISDEQSIKLNEMADIFKGHDTKLKIVISPLYSQEKFSLNDLESLQRIFSTENVYDYSGKNAITDDYRNYYENSHYRSKISERILMEIYNPQ